jgi:hypothetical protein
MRGSIRAFGVGLVLAGALFACSSDGTNPGPAADGGAPTARIVRPAEGQVFKPSDTIVLEGTGSDPIDGDIAKAVDADKRMIWNLGADDRSVNPAGEGPTDEIGAGTDIPVAPGTYLVRFDVTNTRGQTVSARVTIRVE